MKKKCLLPIMKPDFICQNYITCANSVVKANAREYLDVLRCSKYVNCYFDKNDPKHHFVISVFDHWCVEQKLMRFQFIDLLKEPYQKRKKDVANIIKKCLLQGSYILTQCNRTYFEETDDPNSMLFFCLLVGFDDETQTFTLYGKDLLDRFSCCQVKYQTFLDALFDTAESNIPFQLWSYNKKTVVTLDLPNLIFELEDYIYSTNRRKNASADNSYGLNAVKDLSCYFCETAKANSRVNEVYLHNFLMHKSFMKDRIKYLAEKEMVNEIWVALAEQVFQMGKEIVEWGEEGNRSHDRSLIEKLVKKMHASIELETNYLPEVLEELKKYHQTK